MTHRAADDPVRAAFLAALAARIVGQRHEGVLRVAITGVDGAGKTRLADELAPLIERAGLPVIRGSIDGFHNPRAIRYRRGRDSPEGFYRDSFDIARFKAVLLDPLGPGGSRVYRTAAFDHRTDLPVRMAPRRAPVPSVLIVDGIFLQRPDLAGCWDLTIFLDVPFAVTFARMALRDGGSPDAFAASNRRYREGQLLYLAEGRPRQTADIHVDYADIALPRIIRG